MDKGRADWLWTSQVDPEGCNSFLPFFKECGGPNKGFCASSVLSPFHRTPGGLGTRLRVFRRVKRGIVASRFWRITPLALPLQTTPIVARAPFLLRFPQRKE